MKFPGKSSTSTLFFDFCLCKFFRQNTLFSPKIRFWLRYKNKRILSVHSSFNIYHHLINSKYSITQKPPEFYSRRFLFLLSLGFFANFPGNKAINIIYKKHCKAHNHRNIRRIFYWCQRPQNDEHNIVKGIRNRIIRASEKG